MKRELDLKKAVDGNMPGIVEECFKEPCNPNEYPNWVKILGYCQRQDITGIKFKNFIISCCEGNMAMALLTKKALEYGLCMPEIVEQNLGLNEPVPFINPDEPVFVDNGKGLQVTELQRVSLYRRILARQNIENNK